MTGKKSMFASIGMMGPAIGIIVLVINFFAGEEIVGEADAQEVVNLLIALAALLTGIWGRYRATKEIA